MPKTLIGIQDWYIACLWRSNRKGWRLFRAKASKALQTLGFTFEQSQTALRDAFDMWELEKIANEAS